MSAFTRTNDYPTWNTQLKIVPDIPNWSHTIGSYTISFQKGAKICFITKVYSGDYTIHISSTSQNWNNHQYTDLTLWEKLLIPNIGNLQNKQVFIDTLRVILNIKIENAVLQYINQAAFNDELKVCLYTLWHRAIIEDRLYPMPRFLGHKQVIGITIAIVKKMMGIQFLNHALIQISPFQLLTDLKCQECGAFYEL